MPCSPTQRLDAPDRIDVQVGRAIRDGLSRRSSRAGLQTAILQPGIMLKASCSSLSSTCSNSSTVEPTGSLAATSHAGCARDLSTVLYSG